MLPRNSPTNEAVVVTRHTGRLGARLARRAGSDAFGLLQRLRHMRLAPKIGMDDVTLARGVETELFRGPDSPKATVNVNVVEAVVYLHGEVKHPDELKELESQARRIPEVRDVENLLRLPKTPAPTRADTSRSHQRSGTPRRRPARHTQSLRKPEPPPATWQRGVRGASHGRSLRDGRLRPEPRRPLARS